MHDKTNKMTCAPRQDSDQPGHLSLFWAHVILLVLSCGGSYFSVCMKKPGYLATHRASSQDRQDAQADLCLMHISFCKFCHVLAQNIFRNMCIKLSLPEDFSVCLSVHKEQTSL